jgi:predicted RNA-binding protein with PUA domain
MIPLTARFCVGCGQVFDELQPSDSRPCWIAAHAYREKYGCRFTDLHLIEDVCPLCAHVITIGRPESLPETLSEAKL